jgi:hypothetical protein
MWTHNAYLTDLGEMLDTPDITSIMPSEVWSSRTSMMIEHNHKGFNPSRMRNTCLSYSMSILYVWHPISTLESIALVTHRAFDLSEFATNSTQLSTDTYGKSRHLAGVRE